MLISYPIHGILLFHNLTHIQGQGHSSRSHSGSNILSTHIPFVPCHSTLPFLIQRFFIIWLSSPRSGSQFKVKKWVGLTIYSLPFPLCSIYQPSHSLHTNFFKVWPWKFKVEFIASYLKVTKRVWLPTDSHSFRSTSIGNPISGKQLSQKFILKIQGQGHSSR